MKKYFLSLISIIITVGCIIAYNIIGVNIAQDGTLIEPFFLIPMAWLFALISVVSALIVKIGYNYKKHKNN